MTRLMMNLCVSKPHADAGRGTAAATKNTRTIKRARMDQLYLSDEPAQRSQVARIPGIDIALPAALGRIELRRLEQHRQPGKTPVVEEALERLQSQAAFPYMFVAIDAAPAGFLRIVQVEHLDPVETDQAFERTKRAGVAIGGTDVVPG